MTHIRSYKTRLNSDAELIDFAELILLNLINNIAESRNLNVRVSVSSRTEENKKMQIDSL